MEIAEYYTSVSFINWEKTDEFSKLAWSNQIPVDVWVQVAKNFMQWDHGRQKNVDFSLTLEVLRIQVSEKERKDLAGVQTGVRSDTYWEPESDSEVWHSAAILCMVLLLTGNQWRFWKSGEMCSDLSVLSVDLAAAFWTP